MSLSTELTSLAGNTVILAGKSNYQRWAWSVEGTARLGLFWSAFDGTNTPLDTSAAQKESSSQREMKALGLIMKTVDPVIALELQSMPSISDNQTPATTRRPTAKEIWEHLQTRYQKSDSTSSLYRKPAASPPSPKDLGQDVRAWGKKKKPPTQNNAMVNNVESSSTNNNARIFFYDRADIATEPSVVLMPIIMYLGETLCNGQYFTQVRE